MTMQPDEQKGTTNLRTVKRIGAREACNNFSDLIGLVYYNGETIVVERSGKPVAAIIPFDLYERIATETTFAYPMPGDGAPRCYRNYARYSKLPRPSQPLRRFPKQKSPPRSRLIGQADKRAGDHRHQCADFRCLT